MSDFTIGVVVGLFTAAVIDALVTLFLVPLILGTSSKTEKQ